MVRRALPLRRRAARHRRRPERRTVVLRICGGLGALAIVGVGTAAGVGAFSGANTPPVHDAERHRSTSTTAAALGSSSVAASSSTSTSAPPTAARATTTVPSTTTTTSPTTTSATTSTTSSTTSTTTAPTTTTTTLATLPASEVLVEVLNGTGAQGQAGQAAAALHALGFGINGTGNATSFEHPVTLVAYPPGEELAAETVARHVLGTAELQSDGALPPGVVDLVLGYTYDGVSP